MIFYTADLHFGDSATMEKARRPFSSAAEMDEVLIRRWNDAISSDDTVYLVGDMSLRCGPIPGRYLSQLNGHIHLIRGNHDTGLDSQEQLFDYVESVSDFLEIEDGEQHILLCHYPLLYMQRGLVIHGHLHNYKGKGYQILRQLPHVLNAGVDINDFRPVTLEALIENNRRFYQSAEKGPGGHAGRESGGTGHKIRYFPLPDRMGDRR